MLSSCHHGPDGSLPPTLSPHWTATRVVVSYQTIEWCAPFYNCAGKPGIRADCALYRAVETARRHDRSQPSTGQAHRTPESHRSAPSGDRLPCGRTLVARSHIWSLTCRRSPARVVAWLTKYKKSARSSQPVFPPALGLVRGTWSALSALLEASPRPTDGCISRTVINPCSASGSRRLRSHGLSARGLRALPLLS